jgi:membrane-associated phospholipid phosphatase
VVRELLLIGGAAVTYVGVRALTEGSVGAAVDHGLAIFRIERVLGIAWEHDLQAEMLPHAWLVDLANWIYIWGHWPVIAIAAVALFSFRRDRYRLLRNAVLISGAIGFLFFALLPTAPPRLVDVGLVDTIVDQSSSYRALQPPSVTNQYAAMPSLHFGWNLLVGIVLFATTRSLLLRSFAVVMPVAMALSVVATANHWVLDVVVGGTVVLAGLLLACLTKPTSAPWEWLPHRAHHSAQVSRPTQA